MFSFVCASVSVSPVRTLTVESRDLETSSLVCRHIFRISRPSSYIKVSGQGQGHNIKEVTWLWYECN